MKNRQELTQTPKFLDNQVRICIIMLVNQKVHFLELIVIIAFNREIIMQPLITVIVPVYNAEKFLERTLMSICNQTYRELEIILVDDGSTDKSLELMERYSEKDNRMKVYHTENRGSSAARNYGLDRASGEYIGFVDADDWLESTMYEKMYHRMKEDLSQLVTCGMNRFFEASGTFESGFEMENGVYSGEAAFIEIMKNNSGPCNKLYDKKMIGDIRFREELKRAEDPQFIFEIVRRGITVSTIHEVLYHYNFTEGSRSNKGFTEATWDVYRVGTYIFDNTMQQYTKKSRAAVVGANRFVGASYIVLSEIAKSPRKLTNEEEKLLLRVQKKIRANLILLVRLLNVPLIQKTGVMIMAVSPKIYIQLLKRKSKG